MSKVRLTSGGRSAAADEVVQHVAHGDRLDPVVQPLRRDHRRQPRGEVAQHLERRRPRADDHRGLQHRRRHARGHQQLADLDPRGQVLAEVTLLVTGPSRRGAGRTCRRCGHAGLGGRRAEGTGELAVALDEAGPAVHRVQEVVGDVHAGERLGQGVGRRRIALDDLDLVAPLTGRDLRLVAGEHPDPVALLEQAGHEARAEVARDAGDQERPWHGMSADLAAALGLLRHQAGHGR